MDNFTVIFLNATQAEPLCACWWRKVFRLWCRHWKSCGT